MYRQILAVEKEQLEVMVREIHELNDLAESLERRRREEQQQLQAARVLQGGDLLNFYEYANLIRNELTRVRNARARKEARMIELRQRVTSTHRRVRLFENLEQRRREEWLKACSIEENALASELFLSAMVKQSIDNSGEPPW